uniref:Uncharacterized protein MANES_01G256600 n=2 Tax=Rhizophora mucronata TaxID=61149 RepID=A0A2P2MAD6_RHIMU
MNRIWKSLNFLYEYLPGWDLMHAGLMSSPGKSGSRTETGLCRSGVPATQSRSLTFLVTGEVDGEINGEDGSSFSSQESCEKNQKYVIA